MSSPNLEEVLYDIIFLQVYCEEAEEKSMYSALLFTPSFPPKMRGYEEPHFVLLIELCEKRKAFVVMLLGCRQSHYNKEKIAYGILINVLNLQRDH